MLAGIQGWGCVRKKKGQSQWQIPFWLTSLDRTLASTILLGR